MAGYFTYLISSLPMLLFGARPPFSFKEFLEICSELIPQECVELLRRSKDIEEFAYEGAGGITLEKWYSFDRSLRNELVKIRAARKHMEAAKYIRQDGYSDPSIVHAALNAHRSASVLEAEMMLDQARWRLLDDLSCGHYFDIDFLIIYAHKLLILERWEKIHTPEKTERLEALLGKG